MTMYKEINDFPNHIFRAYDIRGVVPTDLNENVVFNVGVAYGTKARELGESTVVIARDGRLSGPTLLDSLESGLLSTGCNVINVGDVPTPLLYFAAKTVGTGTGIMLTGSHNPANYNGLKMSIAGNTLAQDEIQELKNYMLSNKFSTGKGRSKNIDVIDDYISTILSKEKLSRKLKVVIDAGNGIAGKMAPKLYKDLGCEVIEMYCEVDGAFPNHHPDPSKPENVRELAEKVIEFGADVGLAFDGDGDRLGLVTNTGKIIAADRQMMLYAKDVIDAQPNATILYDVKCTKDLGDYIKSIGGTPIMYKTGHAWIKKKMKQIKVHLAGEMSGHIFFNDRWFGFDDGLYTGVRLLEILSKTNENLDEIFAKFPESVATPEINIDVTDENKFDIVDEVVARAKDVFTNANIIDIDGVRAEFENGWALLRASNTMPCLVLRFEAHDKQTLIQIQSDFMKIVDGVLSGHK